MSSEFSGEGLEIEASYKLSLSIHRLERITCTGAAAASGGGGVHAQSNNLSSPSSPTASSTSGSGAQAPTFSFSIVVRVNDLVIGSTDQSPVISEGGIGKVVWNKSFVDIKLSDLLEPNIVIDLFSFEKVSCKQTLVGHIKIPVGLLMLDSKLQRKFNFISPEANSHQMTEMLVATLLLEKRVPEFVLQMMPNDMTTINSASGDNLPQNRQKMDQEMLDAWSLGDLGGETVEILKDTLLEFNAALNSESTDVFYIDDLIEEAQCLLKNKGEVSPASTETKRGSMPLSNYIFNSHDDMIGSTYYDFKKYPYAGVRYKPLDFFGVQMVFYQNLCFVQKPECMVPERPVYSFVMRNRYSLWAFWRFFITAMDYWRGRANLMELPTWLSETGEMNDIIEVMLSQIDPTTNEMKDGFYRDTHTRMNPLKARIVLSIQKPFTITLLDVNEDSGALAKFNIEPELNLNYLLGAYLSTDCRPPSSHVLELKVISVVDSPDPTAPAISETSSSVYRSPSNVKTQRKATILETMGKQIDDTLVTFNKELNKNINKSARDLTKATSTVLADIKSTSANIEAAMIGTIGNNHDRLNKLMGISQEDGANNNKKEHKPHKLKSVLVPVNAAASLINLPYSKLSNPHMNIHKDRHVNMRMLSNLEDLGLDLAHSMDILGLNPLDKGKSEENIWYVVVKRGSDRHVGIVPRSFDDLDTGFEHIVTIGLDLDPIFSKFVDGESDVGSGGQKQKKNQNPKQPEPSIQSAQSFNKEEINDVNHIDIYLLSGGKSSNGFVVGYQQLPISYLKSLDSGYHRNSEGRSVNVRLNSQLKYEISFAEITGMKTLAGFSKHLLVKNIFFECFFVGHYGQELPNTKPVMSDVTSLEDPPHKKTFSNNFKVTMSDDFGACAAQYIRLKMCIGNKVTSQVVGYIFIPLDHFGTENSDDAAATDEVAASSTSSSSSGFLGFGVFGGGSGSGSGTSNNGRGSISEVFSGRKRIYPVVRHGLILEGTGGQGGIEDLGLLSLGLRKIVTEKSDGNKSIMSMMTASKPVVPTLTMISKINVRRSSLFSCMWQADCFDSSTMGEHSERFSVYPYHTYLALFDENARYYACSHQSSWSDIENIKDEAAAKRNDPTDLLATAEIMKRNRNSTKSNKVKFVEVEVYENQRRSFFFPYDFGSGNLTPLERKQFTDESGSITFNNQSLNDIPPPLGFEWSDNWTFDRAYTETDQHGWTYGIKFMQLRRNFRRGKSDTSSFAMSVRRRRWLRRAIPSKTSSNVDEQDLEYTWRDEVYFKHPKRVIGYCQEKKTSKSPVLISWKNIEAVAVVTPSILSIRAIIHQYFGPEIFNKWGSIAIDIYIQNCPAYELKELISHRMELGDVRDNLTVALMNRGASGLRSSIVMGAAGSEHFSVNHSEESKTLTQIYYTRQEFEEKLASSIKGEGSVRGIADLVNRESYITRQKLSICRLKLYSYVVLMSNFPCSHNFSIEDISQIFRQDLKMCSTISDAVEKIKFIMYALELRLLDSIVSGWSRRHKPSFKTCIESFINYYFIEIVNVFSRVLNAKIDSLDSQFSMDAKLRLIPTYLEHNQRFHKITNDLLNLHGFKLQPSPSLDSFMKFQTLLDSICGVVHTDMKSIVIKAVTEWKGKHVSQSKVKLPWQPIKIETSDYLTDSHRYLQSLKKRASKLSSTSNHAGTATSSSLIGSSEEEQDEVSDWVNPNAGKGMMLPSSLIPEEISKLLEKYLLFVKKEKIEDRFPSLKECIVQLYTKLASYHVDSFKLLATEYSRQIKAAVFPDASLSSFDAQEFDAWSQMIDWLISCINDLHRAFRCGLIESTLCRLELLDEVDSRYSSSPYANINSVNDGCLVDGSQSLSPVNTSVARNSETAIVASIGSCYIAMRSSVLTAVDRASNVLMYLISMLPSKAVPPSKVKLLDNEFFQEWRQTAIKRHSVDVAVSKRPKEGLFSMYIKDTYFTLSTKLSAIDPLYIKPLIISCTRRLCLRFLLLVKEAASSQVKLTATKEMQSPEFLQFQEDLHEIEDGYNKLVGKYSFLDTLRDTYSLLATKETSPFCSCAVWSQYIKYDQNDIFLTCRKFLTLVDSRVSYAMTLASLITIVESNTANSQGALGFIVACMNLRGDFQWSKKFYESFDTQTGLRKQKRQSVISSFMSSESIAVKDFDNPIERAIISAQATLAKLQMVDLHEKSTAAASAVAYENKGSSHYHHSPSPSPNPLSFSDTKVFDSDSNFGYSKEGGAATSSNSRAWKIFFSDLTPSI